MTKEEAEKVLEKSRERFSGVRTCPLKRDFCDQTRPPYCQAYDEGAVYSLSEQNFGVRSASCLSLAVSCHVEIETV